MKNLIYTIVIMFILIASNNMFGQNNGVTIGGSETRSDAVLWLIPSGNDGNQGLVLPQTEREGFVPTIEGMVIFDPTDQTIYFWDGAFWQGLGSGGTGTADDWGTQTVISDDVLIGEGTVFDPLTLASQDAGLGQVLKWNGTSWAPALDETGAGGSSVNSINEITGDGTVASPLQLAQQAATVGQILKWDGTAWTPAEDLNGGSGATYNAGDGISIDVDNNIINTGDADADPGNEFQTLSFDVATNELSLSDGNSISIPTGGTDADADPTNEIQDLTLSGTTIEISGGTGVDIGALIPVGGTDDQNLVIVGDELSIEGGTGTVDLSNYIDDADANPTNEIQTLSFDGATNELSLSDGGSVTIPTGGTDADADPTNEIQDLTLSGTTIEISGGTGVDIGALIPAGGTDDQNLIIVGDELSIEGGAGTVDLGNYIDDADADATNEIQTISINGLTGDLELSNGGGSVALPSGGSGAFESSVGVVRPSVVNSDDFVFGSVQLNDDLTTADDNNRMFFDKGRGAFRVGDSGDTDVWDVTNIGSKSMAFGDETRASGFSSVAMGDHTESTSLSSTALGYYTSATAWDATAMGGGTTASGTRSTAMGNSTIASGQNSTSMGFETEANGTSSTAIGNETTASGTASFSTGSVTQASGDFSFTSGFLNTASGNFSAAMGSLSTASNTSSFAIGNLAQATEEFAIALGLQVTSSGNSSLATGSNTTASGDGSMAMNQFTTASGTAATAMGRGTFADSYASTAIGQFNIGFGNADSWESGDKVFEIGIGLDGANRANAMTVLKNGRVGLGEINPTSSMVIGSNFNFSIPSTQVLSVGGGGESGGSIVVGDNDKYFHLRCDEWVSRFAAIDAADPDGLGIMQLDASTVRLGDASSVSSYMLDIAQNEFFGVHQTNGSFGWERVVHGSSGALQLYTDNSLLAAVGSFDYASGAYSALSDRNSKEDVKSIGYVMGKVKDLEPLRYQFIGTKDNKKSLGFIAQDVNEIFPELVTFHEGKQGAEGRHLMDYSGFGVIAIAAIQEQQAQIESQQAQIDTQQEEMTKQQMQIETLTESLEQLMKRVKGLEINNQK